MSAMRHGFERWVDAVLRWRRAVVVTLLALTALWASQLPALRVEIDPDASLPQEHPYIHALHVLQERFGEKNLIVIGLFPKDGDVFTPAFLTKLERITRRIEQVPELIQSTYLSLASRVVKSIEGDEESLLVRPVVETTPDSPAAAAEVRRRVFANPFYPGILVAADGSATAIIANFRLTPALPGYPQIQEAIARIVAGEDDGTFDVHYGGPVAVSAGLAGVTERTILLFPLALLVVALIHYEAFRTVQAMVLPLVTALLAVVWSLCFMGLAGLPLDPFNTTTPILILAVAAGHAVQILKRYYEEIEHGRDSVAAVRAAVVRVGPVMVTAGLIAALSFFSLAISGTATVRNFGLLTGFGIVSALVLELTFIPALRAMLPPRPRETQREARSGRFLDALLGRLVPVLLRRPRTVIGVAGLLAALAAIAATRLHVDTSFKRQFGPGHAVRIADDTLNTAFAGTSTFVLIVEGPSDGALREPAILGAIAETQRFIETDPAVGKTLAITDFVREIHRVLAPGDAARAPLPSTRAMIAEYLALPGARDLESQIDPRHRSAAVRVFLRNDSTEYAEDLMRRVRARVAATFPPGYTVRYSGTVASNAALTEVMVRGKIVNVVQVALIIVVVAGLVLRSVLGGVLVAIPLAMAVLVNFGTMGIAGMPLDVITTPIAALSVGIGADYAVYFLFRFREELATTGDRLAALTTTMRTSGKAIIYVSSAIAGGYLVLALSGYVLHREIGLMVALAMLTSSVAAITLLPALVLVTEPAFLFGTSARGGAPLAEGAAWR